MPYPTYGIFANGIPYARIPGGDKDLLLLFGGPGNTVPTGFGLRQMTKGFDLFLNDYTLTLVTRRSGLLEGHTTRDMADDYAVLIRDEFGGRVELIIGYSYGGLIAQHFGADHYDLCDYLVIAAAAHHVTAEGVALDRRYAQLLSEGNDRAALALVVGALVSPGAKRTLVKAGAWLAGGLATGDRSPAFAQDVLIEAEAEANHDAREALGRIQVPTLIVAGAEDPYFPIEYVKEMADLIPGAVLQVYKDRGHVVSSEPSFARDVYEFCTWTRAQQLLD